MRCLEDLEKAADKKAIEYIFTEYILIQKGKADAFDKIEKVLRSRKTDSEKIKEIKEIAERKQEE